MQTRRSFLRGLSGGASFLATRALPVGFGVLATTTPVYAAGWVAALAAAQTVLSILSSMSRSDGGIGAMLSGQKELLGIVINQLNDIQADLTKLSIEIQKLEDKYKAILFDFWRDDNIADIGAAAGSYAELLIASQKDPKTFDQEPVRARMALLADTANRKRNKLTIIPGGFGPEAALAVPLAFGLEVTCSSKIGFNKSVILTILNGYKAWLTGMATDQPGSIVRYRAGAVDDYARTLEKAADTRLGVEFKISEFTLDKDDWRQSGADYCVLTSDYLKDLGKTPVDKKHYMMGLDTAKTTSFGNRGGVIYERLKALELSPVESIKVSQIAFSDGALGVIGIAHNGTYQGFEPQSYQCYVRGKKAILDVDAAIKFAESSEMISDFTAELVAFEELLNTLNLARARIGFSDRASEVAKETLKLVEQQIAFLEGD